MLSVLPVPKWLGLQTIFVRFFSFLSHWGAICWRLIPHSCGSWGYRDPLPPPEFHDLDIHSNKQPSSCVEALSTYIATVTQLPKSAYLLSLQCLCSSPSSTTTSIAEGLVILPYVREPPILGMTGNWTRVFCTAAWCAIYHFMILATPHPPFFILTWA